MIDIIHDMVYVYQVLTLYITVCLTLSLLHALSANGRMKYLQTEYHYIYMYIAENYHSQ